MEDSQLRAFFLQPTSACQRQYEALRAVFVDGLPQKEVAQRFGYSYDSFRQLVCDFRQGSLPPFSTGGVGDDLLEPHSQAPGRNPTSRKTQAPEHDRSSRR